MNSPSITRRSLTARARPYLTSAVAGLVFVYVLANVICVNFATIIHPFQFRVLVVDAESGRPVRGAVVDWDPSSLTEALGRTDESGSVEFESVIQEQPWWFWPKIGAFQFHGRAFRVSAPGHEDSRVSLRTALPGVPYRRPEGVVGVALTKSR